MSQQSNWQRMEEVYSEAMEVAREERTAFVESQCGEDSELLAGVLTLLRSRDEMGEFLKGPVLEFSGQVFGAYRAGQEIGRGGMSVVYEGARIDGDFDKRVAIKVILVSTGRDLAQSETQILAGLEHPNIARMLDAGQLDLGFRYLVMELVEGKPCTEVVTGWSEQKRLELFLEICRAVGYAHRSLVVHRDLKPQNILVDLQGNVKLLDFGIAKLLAADLGTEQTRGVSAFTADYASPEQILGQSVTTGADIYSLGVLLCALVGGRVPRELDGMELGRLLEKVKTEEVETVPLAGDLALIARKALRRDANERYESVVAMAGDIESYLKGMPITARPPSWGYVSKKFLARNRVAVAGVSLAVLGLVSAAGIALTQEREASERFEQVRTLSRSVMFELHDAVVPLKGSTAARKLIVDKSLVYLDALAKDAEAREDVQLDVVKGYLRLSDLCGKDLGVASMGSRGDAFRLAEQAIEVARRVVIKNPGTVQGRELLVDALAYAGMAQRIRGNFKAAELIAQESVAEAEKLAARTGHKERLAEAIKNLADSRLGDKKLEEILQSLAQSIALSRELYQQDQKNVKAIQRLAEAEDALGRKLWDAGRKEEMPPHAREAYRLSKEWLLLDKGARSHVALYSTNIGVAEMRAGNFEQAVELVSESVRLREQLLKENPDNKFIALRLGVSLDRLGYVYGNWGKYTEAILFGERALAQARALQQVKEVFVPARQELAYALVDLADNYQNNKQLDKACPLLKEAFAMFEQPPPMLFPALKTHRKRAEAIVGKCGRRKD